MTRVAIAGNFFPLHEGHLEAIENARKHGDYLIVIVGNDDHLKRKGKPVLSSEENRARLLRAIRGVDEVVVAVDKDGTCAETLRMVRPDVFVKDADRKPENMPENEIKVCDEIGCKIVYEAGKKINRSSAILRKMGVIRDELER